MRLARPSKDLSFAEGARAKGREGRGEGGREAGKEADGSGEGRGETGAVDGKEKDKGEKERRLSRASGLSSVSEVKIAREPSIRSARGSPERFFPLPCANKERLCRPL